MELRLGRLNIRPLMDKLRRDADRQTMRQCEGCQIEIRRRPVAGRTTDQNRQRVLGHAQLLFKCRLQCLIRRKLAFGNNHIAIGHSSGLALLAHELHILTIDSKDIIKGFQLRADRGCLKRQGNRVAG